MKPLVQICAKCGTKFIRQIITAKNIDLCGYCLNEVETDRYGQRQYEEEKERIFGSIEKL